MEGERTILAEHPALTASYDNATSTWSTLDGWEQVAPTILIHETSIDLSGYAMEDLTLYVEELGLQDPGVYSFIAGGGATFSGVQIIDVILSAPIKDFTTIGNSVSSTGIGMIGSPYNFEQILLGTYRFFTPNQLIAYPGFQQLTRTQRFDSGQPNAADKLFAYRIAVLTTNDLDGTSSVVVPAARQMINGRFFKEEDLHHMMRLKRSYELANQV
jgi:hypothetical protein